MHQAWRDSPPVSQNRTTRVSEDVKRYFLDDNPKKAEIVRLKDRLICALSADNDEEADAR